MVLLFIRAPSYVLLVFIAICAVFWLFWLSYQYLPSDWLERLLFCVSLGSWIISLTVVGASVTNLNEPFKALATTTICGLGASSIPFGPLSTKATRVKGVIMSLALHYWMGDVHHCTVFEMTSTVSSGTLNSTIPYHTWTSSIFPFHIRNSSQATEIYEKCLRMRSEHTSPGVSSSSCRSMIPQAPPAQPNSSWSQMSAVQPSVCFRVWRAQPPS